MLCIFTLDKLILSPWDLTPPSPASRALSPGQCWKAIYFLDSTHHTAFLGLFILSSMSQFYPSSSTYPLNLCNLLLKKKKKKNYKRCAQCTRIHHRVPCAVLQHHFAVSGVFRVQKWCSCLHIALSVGKYNIWGVKRGLTLLSRLASNSQLASSYLSLLNPGWP